MRVCNPPHHLQFSDTDFVSLSNMSINSNMFLLGGFVVIKSNNENIKVQRSQINL